MNASLRLPSNPSHLPTPMRTPSRILCAAALAPALLLSSCVSPYYGGPNQSMGGVVGAVTGAAAGGIIGNQSGRGLEGAAIGGVLGSILGSAAGYSQDYAYGYAPPPPAPIVVQPSYGYYGGYYGSGGYGYCRPRYYRSHSPCW